VLAELKAGSNGESALIGRRFHHPGNLFPLFCRPPWVFVHSEYLVLLPNIVLSPFCSAAFFCRWRASIDAQTASSLLLLPRFAGLQSAPVNVLILFAIMLVNQEGADGATFQV